MRLPPRILLLHASVGSGHTRAAEALGAALRELSPGACLRSVDVLELATAAFRSAYGLGYLGLAKAAPHLLGYLYDLFDRPSEASAAPESARRLLQAWGMRSFSRFLEREPWDAVVHTHFLPAELLASLRRAGRLRLRHAVAVTDFDAHRFWAQLPAERFFVASEEAAASLRYWGARPESIEITGIPIDASFAEPLERAACRRALGLPAHRPVILQLGGGFGLGPLQEAFGALLSIPQPCQLVVVCGRNEALRRALSRLPIPVRHQALVLGFTDRMRELLGAADLVVTKPGGLTTAEALAAGTPMAIVQPIPGQESRNSDYLLERGAAIKAPSLAALPGKVAALLARPDRLDRMAQAAAALGRPRAAREAARSVLRLAGAVAAPEFGCEGDYTPLGGGCR